MSSSNQLHVIVGLGATGISCAHFLHRHGIPFAVTDTRLTPPNLDEFKKTYPDVEMALGELSHDLLSRAGTIVLSPGLGLQEPAIAEQVKRGIPVIGDIELFVRGTKVPIIAITGTNAKSTVTTLVGKMAEAAGYQVEVGGNLGIPALELIDKNPATNLFVLELSSFQLETTHSLKAAVATVLNISPDHMDRYETLADYQQAKHRIYQNCEIAVYNRDDALTYYQSPDLKRKISFTLNTPMKDEFGLLRKDGEVFLAYENQPLLSIRELPVIGKHYQANALASLAIGYSFGFVMEPMLKVLREFKGLPHRCQFVRERNGIVWYNDSKGTNVGATQAAIEGIGSEIPGKLVMIAGGLGKNADFKPLVSIMAKYSRHVVLIGEAAQELASVIDNRIPFSFAKSMEEAVSEADKVAQKGDCVLLSPACASWDMFKHYAHRGEVFAEAVERL